ncbi:hypothetical protein V6Z11_D01G133300 [Gossypium hirsutum]
MIWMPSVDSESIASLLLLLSDPPVSRFFWLSAGVAL